MEWGGVNKKNKKIKIIKVNCSYIHMFIVYYEYTIIVLDYQHFSDIGISVSII